MTYTWLNDAGLIDSRYQYNGKELNEDYGLGLSDYLLRWYDAAIGRWAQVDLLSESDEQIGINPYHYTFNNPISYFDPWGLQGTNEYVKDNETGEYVQVGDKGGDDTDYVYGGTIFKDEEGNVTQVNYNTSEANTTVIQVEITAIYIGTGIGNETIVDRSPGALVKNFTAPASGQITPVSDPITGGVANGLGTYAATGSVKQAVTSVGFGFGKGAVKENPYILSAKKKAKLSGKEKASNIPDWAQGHKPAPGGKPTEFARRILDEKYGAGNWNEGPTTEYNRIKKYAERLNN
ncbi:MAG: hypothetical protein JNJ57_21290 [Saprospiraceae bacterium]|nr:hypothetical protein [Saprospiraceae bacterium]